MFGQMEIRWCLLRPEDKTPANRLRLERLYESIVHSVIVLENGELIQKHTGNPSGSGNTIVDNTMILFRLFAYAWILLVEEEFGEKNKEVRDKANTPDLEGRSYEGVRFGGYADFMRHVKAALNGDDNTYTCSNYVVKWFTPARIGAIWTAIGVSTKTPCNEPRKLSECSFLSQGFNHYQKKLWLPRPETDRILSSLMWGSSVDDVRWHLMRACALRIDSWGNEEVRIILKNYIEFIWANYADQLVGKINDLDMGVISSVYKTDDWIWSLYSGFEGAADTIPPLNFSFIHKIVDTLVLDQVIG